MASGLIGKLQLMNKPKVVFSFAALLVVEFLACYFFSFVFMLEGAPDGHNSVYLSAAAMVCIGIFFLAPIVWVFWLLR